MLLDLYDLRADLNVPGFAFFLWNMLLILYSTPKTQAEPGTFISASWS